MVVSEAHDRSNRHPGTSAIGEFLGIFGEGGLTEDDYRHMDGLARSTGRGKVSHRLCEEIRTRRHRGESAAELAKRIPIDLSHGTITFHAGGKCQHYVDVPPANTQGRVTDLMCGLLRQARWQGIGPTALAEMLPCEFTHSSVSHHTTGHCTHDTSVPPFTRRTVSAEQCAEWNERREEGEPMPKIAQTSPFEYGTVAAHTNGECNHEQAVPESRSLARRDRCREWRERIRTGTSPASVASDAGVSDELVRRHATGACEHGFDIREEPPLRYNGAEWVSAADLWGGR